MCVGGWSRPQEAGELWDAEQGRAAEHGRAAATETCCPAGADPGGREEEGQGGGDDTHRNGPDGLAPGRGALVPGFPIVQWGQAALVLRSPAPLWRGTEGPRAQSKALEHHSPGADLSPSAAAGRSNSRSQSLRSTDARRREELGDELQQFGFPSPQTGELQGWMALTCEDKNAVEWGRSVSRD